MLGKCSHRAARAHTEETQVIWRLAKRIKFSAQIEFDRNSPINLHLTTNSFVIPKRDRLTRSILTSAIPSSNFRSEMLSRPSCQAKTTFLYIALNQINYIRTFCLTSKSTLASTKNNQNASNQGAKTTTRKPSAISKPNHQPEKLLPQRSVNTNKKLYQIKPKAIRVKIANNRPSLTTPGFQNRLNCAKQDH